MDDELFLGSTLKVQVPCLLTPGMPIRMIYSADAREKNELETRTISFFCCKLYHRFWAVELSKDRGERAELASIWSNKCCMQEIREKGKR